MNGKIENWLANNINSHFVTINSKFYPRLLKHISNPPPYLFVKGDVELLNKLGCAIVGSRSPVFESEQSTKEIAKLLAKNQICIVSGLAIGIDSIAHSSALDANGTTIAVLPCGIDQIYPKRHTELADQILAKGAIISEFMLGEPARKANFVRRNRIVTGLTKSVVIIECGEKSGTISSARHALAQNREVLVVPLGFNKNFAKGNIQLIKDGAYCLCDPEDALRTVLEINGFTWQTKNYPSFESLASDLKISAQSVFVGLAKGTIKHKKYGYQVITTSLTDTKN